MKKFSILLIFLMLISELFIFIGCISTTPNNFDSDEYIWENWNTTTNRILIEQNNIIK